MGKLKKLAGQTAVYGLSSILGRLLNYLLVSLHTRIFLPESFGVITELYAYATFIMVLLTYGMETGYFRFSEKENNPDKVYGTVLTSLFISSLTFILLIVAFSKPIANALQYSNHPEYIIWFGIIMAVDAFVCIPFARLRQQNKAFKFALFKLINIGLYIFLNLFFLLFLPWFVKNHPGTFFDSFYSDKIGVGYVFIANLIASLFMLVLLYKEIILKKINFDKVLLKKMLIYSLPLLIAGLAGMINETLDRILLKHFLPPSSGIMENIGIYGANYKVAILMTLFIQMFRYAAEPFFFSTQKDKDAKKMYADVMKYFVLFCLFIFLGVMLYIDVIKYFIGEKFHSGLKIVPIVLVANLFLGIVFNLSIWYKLTNQTKFGAYIAIVGAGISILINVLFIPLNHPWVGGYMGSAWAHFFCYLIMMIISFILGQKYYKVKYDYQSIALYTVIAMAIFFITNYLKSNNLAITLSLNTVFFVIFGLIVVYKEKLILLLVRPPKKE